MQEIIHPRKGHKTDNLEYIRQQIPGFFHKPALDLCKFVAKSGLMPDVKDDVSFVEIGIHCGKSFIPLSNLFSKYCSRFYAIDIFDLDPDEPHATGEHGKKRFLENLDLYSIVPQVTIFQEYSTKLSAEMKKEIGNIGFASIDGSHSYEDTKNDLDIISEQLHPKGSIIIDDVFHKRYIEVVWALQEFIKSQDKIIPWLVGGNKVFLAYKDRAKELYEYVGKQAPFDIVFVNYRLFGVPVLVASSLEEKKLKRKLAYQVQQRNPKLYNYLKNNKLVRKIFKKI